ncbi:MAG: glycosyltransferase family 39 protein [Candidatus Omnitrophica bacterium]|nr:glycosyltransferase family 39 protein [Candidatus Omnitrophota bacterium]
MRNPAKSASFDLLVLFSLSSFFLLFRLGYGSLASWDEAIYASVAKEIVASGDWFRFTLNGAPWFDKPPAAIWATAFFYKIFGVNEFSARLFSALCGMGAVFTTYALGAKLFNRWTGYVGALILLSSLHFIRFTRFGMMDGPLTFFMTLAFYFFWLGRDKNRYLIFAGITAGAAILTKSFVALFLFPIQWLFCWWTKETDILGRSSYWIGVMLAVLIALPWNVWEICLNQGAFFSEAIVKHGVLRTFTALEGHDGNFYFYIRVLVNKYHPWVLIGIGSAPFFLFKSIKDREPEVIFVTVWMFFIFCVFTLARTKLPWYIMPLYPPLSLSVAYVFVKIFSENYWKVVSFIFLLIMILHVYYGRIFNQDYSPGLRTLSPVIRKEMGQERDIYLYNMHDSPAVSFYVGKRSFYVDNADALWEAVQAKKRLYLIIPDKELGQFRQDLLKAGFTFKASGRRLSFLTRETV